MNGPANEWQFMLSEDKIGRYMLNTQRFDVILTVHRR